jgi:F0F1-type ATP synthase membrane subunit b/b'
MTPEAIVIIVAVIVVAGILFLLVPRLKAGAAERQLDQRRQDEAARLREGAADRQAKADLAEREANLARAEADAQEARARVHERGLADEELDTDGAPTSTERTAGRPA